MMTFQRYPRSESSSVRTLVWLLTAEKGRWDSWPQSFLDRIQEISSVPIESQSPMTVTKPWFIDSGRAQGILQDGGPVWPIFTTSLRSTCPASLADQHHREGLIPPVLPWCPSISISSSPYRLRHQADLCFHHCHPRQLMENASFQMQTCI